MHLFSVTYVIFIHIYHLSVIKALYEFKRLVGYIFLPSEGSLTRKMMKIVFINIIKHIAEKLI